MKIQFLTTKLFIQPSINFVNATNFQNYLKTDLQTKPDIFVKNSTQTFTGENKKTKKQFYLEMDQVALIGTGGLSFLAGLIGTMDAFEANKKSAEKIKHPLIRALLFNGVLSAGLIASMFGIFQIKYGEKNDNKS